MKWLAQVMHVARKDLRLNGLAILAYAAVAVVYSIAAVIAFPNTGPFSALVPIAGMVIAAILVQADPPARTNAFWASRPLHPGAVFAAKMGLALTALLGVGVLAQAIELVGFAVPAAGMRALLPRVALDYGLFLTVAVFLALLSRDLRGVMAGLVVLTAVAAAISWITMMVLPVERQPRLLDVPAAVTFIAGTVLLGLHQYRTRNRRAGLRVAALVVTAMALVGLLPRRPTPAAAAETRADLATVPAELEVRPGGTADGLDIVAMKVALPAAEPGRRRTIRTSIVTMVLPDGSHETVHGNDFSVLTRSFSGGAAANVASDDVVTVPLRMSHEQLRTIAGAASAQALVMVDVWESFEVGQVPLRPRTTLVRAGYRIRVMAVNADDALRPVQVRIGWVAGAGWPPGPWSMTWDPTLQFALVDATSGATLPLAHRLVGGGSAGVLQRLQHRTASLGPATEDAAPLTPARIARSALKVTGWRYVDSYPVRLDVRVSPHSDQPTADIDVHIRGGSLTLIR